MFFRKGFLFGSRYKAQKLEKETVVCTVYRPCVEFDTNYLISTNETARRNDEKYVREESDMKWNQVIESQKYEEIIPAQNAQKEEVSVNAYVEEKSTQENAVLIPEVKNAKPPKSILKKTKFAEPFEQNEEKTTLTLVSDKDYDGLALEFLEMKQKVAKDATRPERRDTKALIALQRIRAKEQKERPSEATLTLVSGKDYDGPTEQTDSTRKVRRDTKALIALQKIRAKEQKERLNEATLTLVSDKDYDGPTKKIDCMRTERQEQKKRLKEAMLEEEQKLNEQTQVQKEEENNDITYQTRMSMLYSSQASSIFFTEQEDQEGTAENKHVEETNELALNRSRSDGRENKDFEEEYERSRSVEREKNTDFEEEYRKNEQEIDDLFLNSQESDRNYVISVPKNRQGNVEIPTEQVEDNYEPEVYEELDEPLPVVKPAKKKKKKMSAAKSKKSKSVKNINMNEDNEEGQTSV